MAEKVINQYEEIDGFKYIVKDSSKKTLVVLYQNKLREAYDHYVSLNKLVDRKKAYADGMLENITNAPFRLGWLKFEDCVKVDEVVKNQDYKKKSTKK